MPFVFGKDITFTLYPLDEWAALSIASTADPAIYVYQDGYKPDRTEAAAGTDNGGLIGTAITSWGATTDGNGKQFTIPAIDDPEPTSEESRRTFWLALNFYLQNSEQKQTVVRALPMERVEVHHKAVGAAAADLEEVFANIDAYCSSDQQTAAINAATDRCQVDLDLMGFEWAQLWRPDRLKTAVVYKALAILAYGEMQGPNDHWYQLGQDYQKVYETIISQIKLEHIDDADQDPALNATQPTGGYMRFIR